jgi:anti-sigma B factor antagonist
MMDIEAREVDGVQVVDISGKLNTGTSPEAEEYLNELIDEGASKIVLNLEKLDFMSSTGLRVVLSTGKKVAAAGGKLVVCELNPTVREIFKMSGFSTMFDVYDSEEEALQGF